MHTWPVVRNAPTKSLPIVSSVTSASASTSAGSLPPSSSVTRVRLSEAMAMIRLPAPTLPVKPTLRTRGSWISTGPSTASAPETTLSTPGGSCVAMCSTVRTNDSGVVGGALTTTVLPATSAWGSDAARIASGQLKGTISETTPSGSRLICVRNGGAGSSRTAATTSARSAARLKRASKTCISMSHSERTLPFSRDSRSMRSSLSAASAPSDARTWSARSWALSAAHAGKASAAAATAARACASLAAAAWPTTSSGSAGSRTAKVSAPSWWAPPMYSPVRISGPDSVSVMGAGWQTAPVAGNPVDEARPEDC